MDVDNVLADDAPELAGGVALHTNADVRMIVIDGIVMGPRHCAIAGCEAGLLNAQTGVFCQEHEEEMKDHCHMKGCNKNKRMLRRAQEERQDWLPHTAGAEEVEEVSGTKYNNYFSAPRFYCVETICAPCGGVAKILHFLEDGCALLKHIVKQHHWPAWEPTTWIIVDSYHYINHRVTDYLCQTWCNPAPLNGAAPNLVVVDEDKEGRPYYKRAFDTQACEQLNAWLGGFQTVLNWMTVSNFDFTMHCVIARQEEKRGKKTAGIEEVVENEESDDDDIIEY
ncbi:hypothetical protein BDN71DRAFT_1484984 [Pleurotus eryngii]|uniref:CxC6 like cysteine cluster associated with KDZ domain-containing protein n=1 Tax=Pleurotus eryngii TaxID=5323 RepID=A0A9P5ZND6_PLEER|nr:hypothetical protein BDN71DRAFT_1484984 [Pleurotus eryngii]